MRYGRGGSRTHGDITATLDFESSALDHSATLPRSERLYRVGGGCASVTCLEMDSAFCAVRVLSGMRDLKQERGDVGPSDPILLRKTYGHFRPEHERDMVGRVRIGGSCHQLVTGSRGGRGAMVRAGHKRGGRNGLEGIAGLGFEPRTFRL